MFKEADCRHLSDAEKKVIVDKGTERPFSGRYNDFFDNGVYQCKRCGAALYKSDHKFKSSCGWPSFDDEIKGAVKRLPDADGRRIEITCAKCGAHLGHVFEGEYLTPKNVRHCVNSISLTFVPAEQPAAEAPENARAYFAGGCFWGVEYFFEHEPGVEAAVSGYMGGKTENPSYQDVCYGNTGHLEVVEVTYDPRVTNYEKLARLFFEIHDPTQKNGQGPDIGGQYRSVLFFNDESERNIAGNLIASLEKNGYDVVTELRPVDKFWPAEDYHQNYYERKNGEPYCHRRVERFSVGDW